MSTGQLKGARQHSDPAQIPLCSLRQELELSGRQGTGVGYRTIYDPANGKFFRIDRMTFVILRHWGLGKAGSVAEAVNATGEFKISVQDVLSVNSFLKQQFLCLPDEQGKSQVLKAMRLNGNTISKLIKQYLFLKIPVFSPNKFLELIYPYLRFLYINTFWWGIVGIAILSLLLIMQRWDAFLHSITGFWSLEGVAAYSCVIIVSKLFHELGHALTLHHYGQKVSSMGIAILMLMPMLYTDASESWKLTAPRARMNVAAAGILAEILLATLGSIGWLILDDGPWRSACYIVATTNWIMTIFFNMNPLMRFDGYFVLSDYLKMENLHSRAIGQLKKYLAWTFFRLPVRYAEVFSRRKTFLMVVLGIAVVCYRLSIVAGIIALVYFFFFKVLALVLLVHQVWRSLIMPLKMGAKWLWVNRAMAKITKSLIVGLIILIVAIVFIFIPFQYSVSVEGNLKAEEQSTVYVPLNGIVTYMAPKEKELIKKGEVIILLKSPEVEYELDTATKRVKVLEKELAVMGFNTQKNEQRLVRIEELKKVQESVKNAKDQLSRMKIIAAQDARIDWIESGNLVGEWLKADQPIARLSAMTSKVKVIAYVNEIDRERMEIGSLAYFYPINGNILRAKFRVSYIGDHAEQQLKEPIFDAKYGGEILTEGKNGKIIGSFYRVELTPAEELPFSCLRNEMEGNVQIKGEGISIVEYLWRKLRGIVLREMSF